MAPGLKRPSGEPVAADSEGSKRRRHSGPADHPPHSSGGNDGDAHAAQLQQLGPLFHEEEAALLASAGSSGDVSMLPLPGRPQDAAALPEEQLLWQRGAALDQLFCLYKTEYWALMEELRTRHQQFASAGYSALKKPGVTTSADDSEEKSVHMLYRERHPGKQGAKTAAGQVFGRRSEAAAQDAAAGVTAAQPISAVATDTGGAAAEPKADEFRSDASDQEGPAYSDVEDVILGQDPYGAVRETSELLRGYAAFRDRMPQIGRLEECAAAADGREMDRSMAIATLVGARSRFVIRRNSVTIGRAHEDAPGQVEIDLSEEGDARRVSRRAASLVLQESGQWHLSVLGRFPLHVNGSKVAPGEAVTLPHLSLLQAGKLRLLFCVNAGAVRRTLRRSRANAIRQDG